MRKTTHRTNIENILKQGGVFTAKQLHERLPGMDLATMYRNLNAFVKENMVRELHLSKDTVWYEYIQDEHHHAVCDDCGKVLHFHASAEQLKQAIDIDTTKFQIDDIDIVVRGRCLS